MNELFISYISILYALVCFLLREILYSNKKLKKPLSKETRVCSYSCWMVGIIKAWLLSWHLQTNYPL